uniref:Uncharacterized protein n=1 Tax=Romanomermis culicivorax TaxID=13658 RepID=A0A915INF8_ROMCU
MDRIVTKPNIVFHPLDVRTRSLDQVESSDFFYSTLPWSKTEARQYYWQVVAAIFSLQSGGMQNLSQQIHALRHFNGLDKKHNPLPDF